MQRPSCPPTTGWYVVGDLAIDLRGRTVRRPEGVVELTPRNFDLLRLLLDEPEIVHSRESLFERVWGTTCLEDGNLSQAVSVLRKALGESRKDWIRTVAKRGYSFIPPGAPAWQAEPPPDAPPARPSAPTVPTRHRSVRARLSMALVAALVLAIPGSRLQPTAATAPGGAGPPQARTVGIVVIASPRAGAVAEARTATRLLGEWLRWKLGWLPAVNLIDEEQPIANAGMPAYVLDVAVTEDPSRRGRYIADLALRPAIAGAEDARIAFHDRFALTDDGGGLVVGVDAASRRAMDRLFPRRAGERWPALALDMRHADTFLAALDAERAHDGAHADALLETVAQAAPGFAPALWRLATRRGALHRDREADALGQRVAALSTTLPDDARRVLQANVDALSSARAAAAADAFAALERAHPARIDFLLAQAEALQRAQRPEAAMRLLVGPRWDHQPLDVRIRQRIARADIAFTLGSYDIARESGSDAVALIAQADGDWRRELGTAQLILARAWHQQFRNRPMDDSRFRAAERTFRDAGLALDADLAAFHRAYVAGDSAGNERRLPHLLSAANANGDTRLALQLMRMMTQMYDADDRTAEAAALRLRAYRLADASGEHVTRDVLAVDLLEAAVDADDAPTAGLYLQRLRGNRLWAKYRSRIARAESRLDMMRGRYRDALAVLDRFLVEARHNDEQGAAQVEIAKFACLRMDALIALGETALARAEVPACHDIGSGSVPIWATMGRADIARIDGDPAVARSLADRAEALIATRSKQRDSSGWWVSLAEMRIRLSQPDAAERALVAATGRQAWRQLPYLRADIEAGLAEVAAVRRDWARCAVHAAAARTYAPRPDWSLGTRLALLEGAQLQSQGRHEAARRALEALAARAIRLGDMQVARDARALLDLHDPPGPHDMPSAQPAANWLAGIPPAAARAPAEAAVGRIPTR